MAERRRDTEHDEPEKPEPKPEPVQAPYSPELRALGERVTALEQLLKASGGPLGQRVEFLGQQVTAIDAKLEKHAELTVGHVEALEQRVGQLEAPPEPGAAGALFDQLIVQLQSQPQTARKIRRHLGSLQERYTRGPLTDAFDALVTPPTEDVGEGDVAAG